MNLVKQLDSSTAKEFWEGLTPNNRILRVKACTTGNITLSGTQTIDGVSCVAGDLVFAPYQITSTNSDIYTVATGSWVRYGTLTDYDLIIVENGTANKGSVYEIVNNTAVRGTTAIIFERLYIRGTTNYILKWDGGKWVVTGAIRILSDDKRVRINTTDTGTTWIVRIDGDGTVFGTPLYLNGGVATGLVVNSGNDLIANFRDDSNTDKFSIYQTNFKHVAYAGTGNRFAGFDNTGKAIIMSDPVLNQNKYISAPLLDLVLTTYYDTGLQISIANNEKYMFRAILSLVSDVAPTVVNLALDSTIPVTNSVEIWLSDSTQKMIAQISSDFIMSISLASPYTFSVAPSPGTEVIIEGIISNTSGSTQLVKLKLQATVGNQMHLKNLSNMKAWKYE